MQFLVWVQRREKYGREEASFFSLGTCFFGGVPFTFLRRVHQRASSFIDFFQKKLLEELLEESYQRGPKIVHNHFP
jgi:hypothetical protein